MGVKEHTKSFLVATLTGLDHIAVIHTQDHAELTRYDARRKVVSSLLFHGAVRGEAYSVLLLHSTRLGAYCFTSWHLTQWLSAANEVPPTRWQYAQAVPSASAARWRALP